MLLALATVELTHVVGAARWRLLCPKAKFFSLFKLVFISRLYSTVLPGQLFGEAAKVVYISQSNPDITAEEATASVVVDKVVGLIGLLLVGICGALFGREARSTARLPFWFAVCAFALALCVILPAFSPVSRLIHRVLDSYQTPLPQDGRVHRAASAVFNELAGIPQNAARARRFGADGVFVSVSLHSGNDAPWPRGQGSRLRWRTGAGFFAVLSIALLLPVSFAGLGVREGTLGGLFRCTRARQPSLRSARRCSRCSSRFRTPLSAGRSRCLTPH